MSVTINTVNVNNIPALNDIPLTIKLGSVTVNWTYSSTSNTLTQSSFEIWVGSSNSNWGHSDFVGDVYRQPFVRSKVLSVSIARKYFSRGNTYYGQIRIKATDGSFSGWKKFAFTVTSVPFTYNVVLGPASPTTNDDLILSYIVNDASANVLIRWFRNGVNLSQFNNYSSISKDYLRYLDTWSAQVTPYNDIEKGKAVSSNQVQIAKKTAVANNLVVLPERPTDQDILEASYSVLDTNTNQALVNDKSLIRWYVNDINIPEADDNRFVRLALKPGDSVRFELTPNDGLFSGATQSSAAVTILDSDFRVIDLAVDGLNENINVKSVNPTLTWSVIAPYNRRSLYARILVGTAPGADNILSQVIQTKDEQFTLPDSLSVRGADYYVSVSASDQPDIFKNYAFAHFRLSGSLWETSVKNSVGWTIEIAVSASGGTGYQRLSIGDGTKFSELRFYSDKVSLLLGDSIVKSYDLDMSLVRTFIVLGKNSDIQVYYLGQRILDGTTLLTEPSTERFLEIGSGSGSDITGFFKRISYTTEGAFDPLDDSSIYASVSTQSFIEFLGTSVSDLVEFNGDVLVAVNPVNPTDSGLIYRILETEKPFLASTENTDAFGFSVNSLSGSPDNKIVYVSHSSGASFFENHQLVSFHSDSIFISGRKPQFTGWELEANTNKPAASFTQDGLIIDTTFATIGTQDTIRTNPVQRMLAVEINNPLLAFADRLYSFEIANGFFNVYYTPDLQILYHYDLSNVTIQKFVDDFNGIGIGSFWFGLFSDFVVKNGLGNQQALSLSSFARIDWTDPTSVISLYGNFQVTDPLDIDPYSRSSGGNWFYSHKKPGTPWFDRVNNDVGWTIDFDLAVEAIEDQDRPSDTIDPGGAGLYINDGKYQETISFLTQEIVLNSTNKSFLVDNSTMNKFRICGKNDAINIYVKRPTDNEYQLVGHNQMSLPATRQANAGRPALASDSAGNLYSVWHDDGDNGRRQLYFSYFDASSGAWSTPELLVSTVFQASNPDIAIDSIGNVYVVYETEESDYTDIAVIHRGAEGWSEPYLIANDVGDSLNPQVVTDEGNNVHVCWEDHRFPQPEIFYCRRNGINGQWESSAFGYIDTRISASAFGSVRPSITSTGMIVGISWTSFDDKGSSRIYMAYHPGTGAYVVTPEKVSQINAGLALPDVEPTKSGNTNWYSSGQGFVDYLVSSLTSNKADHSDIIGDDKSRFTVVWQEKTNNTYQIFTRILDSKTVYAKDIFQITFASVDSKYPRCSFDKNSFNVYVVFERSEFGVSEPINEYLGLAENEVKTQHPIIMIARYNNSKQEWDVGTDFVVGTWDQLQQVWSTQPLIFGDDSGLTSLGFDVYIKPADQRYCRRPSVPSISYGANLHILYEAQMISDPNKDLPSNLLFTQVRDAVFDHTWSSVYSLAEHGGAYFDADLDLTGHLLRKEIRFGDFSDTVGVKYLINKIRYYLNGAYAPFNIRLISTATTNMPSVNAFCSVCNNRRDAWIGTDKGLLFYDSGTNSVFVFDKTNYGIKDRIVYSIAFDRNANMYIATDDGIYASSDHAYFFKITGNIPTTATSIDTDSRNRVYIGSSTGLYVFDGSSIFADLKVTKDTENQPRTVTVGNITKYSIADGMPSDNVLVIKIDSNDVAWVGTDEGLVRFYNGQISSFTSVNGLSSNKILDIAIRNTGIRYLATSGGVDKMVGISIRKLDLDSLAAPTVEGNVNKIPDASIPKFAHVKAVQWKDPNVLFVATTHSISQIEFVDDAFETEKLQITEFESRDFSLVDISPSQGDGLQTFKIVGMQGRTIPANSVYEVMINGQKITRGFSFSPDKQILRFAYPVRESDLIQVFVRFDVELLDDFTQDQSAQLAIGKKATRVEKLVSREASIFAQTGGDINEVQVNDAQSELPFDRITLDATPPKGKIKIAEQIDKTVFRIKISQLFENNEYVPFDAYSGVDSMIISNFTNFSTDGDHAQPTVPFATSSQHDLGVIFDSITREFTIPVGNGRKIHQWNRLNGTKRMILGTGSPARIYMLNPTTSLWEFQAELDSGDQLASVEFIENFQGKIIVGTGSPTGAGKVWVSLDGQAFTVLGSLPVAHAYCAAELLGVLYIGGGGSQGFLYSYDGQSFEQVFHNISGSIYSLVAINGELYAGTGREGRIYRFDPINKTQQILDSSSDPDILSVGYAKVGDNQFVFAGTGSTAQIRRSKLPDAAFTHSFQTINAPVYSMSNIGGTLWATIGKSAFALENVWTSKFTNSEDIRDIGVGIGDIPWFVSDSYVYKISTLADVKSVYLKLIDRAGNETKLFLPDNTIDPNLTDSITLSQLDSFTNQNRIIEVDPLGNTVFVYNGDDSFYSADKIDQEQGSYFSEIFNGTNSLVSWDRISWDASIPANTGMTISVRTGNSRDEVLDAAFNVVFDGSLTTGDISFLSGQYLQFKVVMTSKVRGLSPALRNVVVRSISAESTHFFTTNFVLPSRLKSGILTSTKMIPIAADIIFGINSGDSVNFGEYQIIDENRIFTMDPQQKGSNLRVGIRLLTPNRGEVLAQDFGEYGPYNEMLFYNAVEWKYKNTGVVSDTFNYRVTFFDTFEKNHPVYQVSSVDSISGFSEDGDVLSSGGSLLAAGQEKSYAFVPFGENPLKCNSYYFVKVEVKGNDIGSDWTTVLNNRTFIESCGTSFVDEIDFNFTNTHSTQKYNFRIRFYSNSERTLLASTYYSGNDVTGWSYDIDHKQFPVGGLTISHNETKKIGFTPDPTKFEEGLTYYLSIDTFDGQKFTNNNNSYTFRVRNVDTSVYCGPYSDVPVVKNFAVMFELEGNQFVTLKVQ